jgi:hypothetical protein
MNNDANGMPPVLPPEFVGAVTALRMAVIQGQLSVDASQVLLDMLVKAHHLPEGVGHVAEGPLYIWTRKEIVEYADMVHSV